VIDYSQTSDIDYIPTSGDIDPSLTSTDIAIDSSLTSIAIDSSLISEKSDDYYEVDRLFRQHQTLGDSIGPLEGYFRMLFLYQSENM